VKEYHPHNIIKIITTEIEVISPSNYTDKLTTKLA